MVTKAIGKIICPTLAFILLVITGTAFGQTWLPTIADTESHVALSRDTAYGVCFYVEETREAKLISWEGSEAGGSYGGNYLSSSPFTLTGKMCRKIGKRIEMYVEDEVFEPNDSALVDTTITFGAGRLVRRGTWHRTVTWKEAEFKGEIIFLRSHKHTSYAN